jgi:hypothetical protein
VIALGMGMGRAIFHSGILDCFTNLSGSDRTMAAAG